MSDFIKTGRNDEALFKLKAYRGEGMVLLAMNWKTGLPPNDFVGFSISYKEPKGTKFYYLKNRISFDGYKGKLESNISPIQKFRWVHFPRFANMKGEFTYVVTPIFMNYGGELSYGEVQKIEIELYNETYENVLNVSFTRGFISSQAFVDFYEKDGPIDTIIPTSSDLGPTFKPTHPNAQNALKWMGFEAISEIFILLDKANADPQAKVKIVAFDLSQGPFIEKLKTLGNRLEIIIDDSKDHIEHGSGENQAYDILVQSAGVNNVKRQHLGSLQHNKMMIFEFSDSTAVVLGSTNFSWRGFYIQANNAVIIKSKNVYDLALNAFKNYWNSENKVAAFSSTGSAKWNQVNTDNIDIQISFSPHKKTDDILGQIANDISDSTKSSCFFSLAFLNQTPGKIRDAITKISNDQDIFTYGISDKKTGGLFLQKPDGSLGTLFVSQLESGKLPEPFKSEPKGGKGIRLHHKFIVLDFDKPTARVYTGSYNFSKAADLSNGENLILIKDRKIAISYMIEALRLVDHYHFRISQLESKRKKILLQKPPKPGESPWWTPYFDGNNIKNKDLNMFC